MAALFFGAVYTLVSLGRHARMETSAYDLGIFTQAVRGYAGPGAPLSEIKGPGFHLLGDHFHPILAVLAPFYRLWPDAAMLLVAQSVLVCASVFPIARFAIRRTGRAAGTAVALAYGLSWGLQGAVAFDFHEIAFAVPLLAFAMVALAEKRWTAAACWSLPLLLVKEDMGLTVAAVGLYLVYRRRRRLGLFLAAAGAAGVVLSIRVFVPAFNHAGVYPYADRASDGLSGVLRLPAGFVEHPEKFGLVLLLLLATAFTAPRSSLLLIAAPSLTARLASDNPLYWDTGDVHYNAILMPIAFVAAVEGMTALRASTRPPLRLHAAAAPWIALAVAIALVPQRSFGDLLSPAFYRADPHTVAADRVLRLIPDGASVAASSRLTPRLAHRTDVVVFPSESSRPVRWIALDLKRRTDVPRPVAVQDSAQADLPGLGFELVAQEDGVILYRLP
ncbi:DUF2079 domain-containing protein [Actinocorallia sp. B10E7]|uniref:DUF2079 domain-containing protein n=1 Tax=Actinocorallia sp. B10E7 TaxID=3153558 RepID=UPI00325DF726